MPSAFITPEGRAPRVSNFNLRKTDYLGARSTSSHFASTEKLNQLRFDAAMSHAYLSFMPIYEFHCGKCGSDSEILVRSSKWEGTACPKCGSKKLTKNLSVFASSGGANSSEGASCTGQPSSCGLCGTGKPHSH
jgi:putative FmdB family regulatory protein